MTAHAESYPISAPKPSTKPKLFIHETQLEVTPEKKPNVVNEGNVNRKKKYVPAKKVMFKENCVKDMYAEPCLLSKPTLHSTNLLTQEIEANRQRSLGITQALKELQLSECVQNTISEEVTTALNYKATDRKYKNLISLNIEDEQDVIPKTRTTYKEKIKDQSSKAEIMDLYFPEDITTERGKTDYKVDIDDNECEESKEDKYSFLFDLYECREYLPHQNFHL